MSSSSSSSIVAIALGVAALTLASTASADPPFAHNPPGQLTPKSGTGRKDTNVYAPEMRFPMEKGPAFANSQVWGNGGGSGPGGGQCDKVNFSYPWSDNYCESRSWDMPLCPSGQGHQGQDIRAATCDKGVHWIVAAVDGVITQVGSYSVYLTADNGTRYDYLHMSDVAVKEGQKVKREEHLGKVSNAFGGTPTTVHLHFNIKQNVAGVGDVYVPPYLSLVESYEDMLGLKPKPPEQPAPITPISTPPEPPAPKETTTAPLPPEPPPPEADTGCSSAPTSSSSTSAASTFLVVVGAAMAGAIRRRRSRRVHP